ncbi:MAG: hypothetical protein NZ529_06680 [Cytophagaceae bacterium]|nr:hypothetical protein [Cytophagaceae bacterium]MDW8456465.1 hypothetical protein [Cytophagaceae bacterium]
MRKNFQYRIPLLKPSLVAVVLLIIFLSGCKRNAEILGPSQVSADENFVLLTPFSCNKQTVRFDTEPLKFYAKFNQPVTWRITAQSTSSEAVKRITSTSEVVDSNTVKWDGSSDNMYFFRSGEDVLIRFEILGIKDTYVDTIRIATEKDYSSNSCLVLYDWDQNLKVKDPGGASAAGISRFNMGVKPLQGMFSLGIYEPASTKTKEILSLGFNEYNSLKYFPITENDPSKVFFNVYIHSDKKYSGVNLLIQFNEDDDGDGNYEMGGLGFSGNNGPYLSEDGYTTEIPLDWVGWKLVSVPLSTAQRSPLTLWGGGGNKKWDLDKIMGFNIKVSSSQSVKLHFDFVTLTFGKPFIK